MITFCFGILASSPKLGIRNGVEVRMRQLLTGWVRRFQPGGCAASPAAARGRREGACPGPCAPSCGGQTSPHQSPHLNKGNAPWTESRVQSSVASFSS